MDSTNSILNTPEYRGVELEYLIPTLKQLKEAIKRCEMDIEKYKNSSDWTDSYYIDEAKENIIIYEAEIELLCRQILAAFQRSRMNLQRLSKESE